IRGFRIELGEIAAVLGQLPSVGKCAVLAREDVPGDKRLVAYVVPAPEAKATANDLRRYLSERLPEYMIPQHWVMLESLPLTANGKLDRLALPAPATERPELEESYVAPRNSVERLLAEVWKQVFGLQRIGVYDNFFELGGDSIRSIQLIARANRQGLRLSPKLLFQHQTISELAAELEPSVDVREEREADFVPLAERRSSVQTGGFTPSDFPHAKISQKDLNLLIASVSRASERKPK
ncbi:MAG TPA: phosphopantetheine-binding protein, partial [Pyrinomonadaceae bacterium]|nr:phosphopantetheine-binding protein [Pyrinomonadaceae bacterium]